MALLNGKYPTLLDLALMPENGKGAEVINLLAAQNPVLEDAPAYECNRGTYHETTVLTGLPQVAWGALYEGIPSTKGTMQTVKDTTGFVNSAAEVDCRLVDIYEKAEKKASVRLQQAKNHLEAMAQEAATAIFYHDSRTNARLPMGLSPRFSSLSAENGSQIIDALGTGGDNTSIWMITWDEESCHLIYPHGHSAGVQRVECGKVPKYDAANNMFMVYREEFTWHFGVTVRNWQYIARVANIDVSDLTLDAATGADIINFLTKAYYRHKGRRQSMGKTFIYMNTTIIEFLDFQARNAAGKNLFLTFKDTGPNAKEVLHFRGIPLRESDGIINSEARVV